MVEPDLKELTNAIDDGYNFVAYSVDIRMLDFMSRLAGNKIKELKS